MITIQTKGRKHTNGWFTLDRVWEEINPDQTSNDLKKGNFEINICPEYLNREVVEIAETMNHEMVHYYNKLSEIKDANGKIHNKKFKLQAEKVGLECIKDPKVGWVTGPTAAFAEYVGFTLKPNKEAFAYFRQIQIKDSETKEKEKKIFKYTCPMCDAEIKAKKEMNIICGKCNEKFMMEDVD
jgi:predicted SprT family Zn-dependent metalloprotease